jgi:hypothetical protein
VAALVPGSAALLGAKGSALPFFSHADIDSGGVHGESEAVERLAVAAAARLGRRASYAPGE